MARPMGSVRLRRSSPVCMALGVFAFVCMVLFFLSGSSSTTSSSSPASLSPTIPYRKSSGPNSKAPPVIRYNMNTVTTTSDPVGKRESVLILTPMSRFYEEYWANIIKLQYPHELITLGFILPKTKEGNQATTTLQNHITSYQKSAAKKDRFHNIVILREDFEPAISSQDESVRHKKEFQKARRSSMAKARNSLLFTTLHPSISWVLWLDADVIETPHTIIQDMASHDQPVLAANTFQRYMDTEKNQMSERPYDFNNWQDSEAALKLGASMGKDDILLEGYHDMATYRALMAFMSTPDGDLHYEVPLDGVGGSALLVKAEVHRDGAMFPPFSFYHLIETEGFAKMVRRLGKQPAGLPNYKVYHYNE
ncbi:Mannan polymerase complex subunit MNN9 [Ceratocystis lukuohia]|uniref:Mannan polymerase complex subunit MNN9 n=3 Tax=Ceratocystis TaxID=5157 RepID=A0A2C5WX91_9PEZI|nr:Mannan polymerase complex subunit MNN9 [Ceratocystis fimbriata CBS 114723]